MQVAAIILAALVVVGGLLWFLDRRQTPEQSDVREPVADSDNNAADGDEECCGQHYSCERDSLLTALSDGIEYYEDEELDRFAGRKSHEYSEGEKDEFRDILQTLLPDDLAGWGRSIQLRGINLPDDVRDEFIMLIDEHRRSR